MPKVERESAAPPKPRDWFTSEKVEPDMSPDEVIRLAIAEHNPVRIFACFSSGNDSLVSTHIAMKLGAHEVFNINTGIGIPEARQHFYEMCDRFNWPFRVKVPPGMSYRDMVIKEGFPGPGAHLYPYSWLKERAIDALIRETKREYKDRVMLITGVRRSESAKRMGYVEPIKRDGCTVWVAPIYAFSTQQRDEYMDANQLPRSPVSDLLHISGECLCGAYTHDGERKEIGFWYPHMEEQIAKLEAEAEAAGQPYCRWGKGKPLDKNQSELPFMPMCVGCQVLIGEVGNAG